MGPTCIVDSNDTQPRQASSIICTGSKDHSRIRHSPRSVRGLRTIFFWAMVSISQCSENRKNVYRDVVGRSLPRIRWKFWIILCVVRTRVLGSACACLRRSMHSWSLRHGAAGWWCHGGLVPHPGLPFLSHCRRDACARVIQGKTLWHSRRHRTESHTSFLLRYASAPGTCSRSLPSIGMSILPGS